MNVTRVGGSNFSHFHSHSQDRVMQGWEVGGSSFQRTTKFCSSPKILIINKQVNLQSFANSTVRQTIEKDDLLSQIDKKTNKTS